MYNITELENSVILFNRESLLLIYICFVLCYKYFFQIILELCYYNATYVDSTDSKFFFQEY